jgi:hypothetical protein
LGPDDLRLFPVEHYIAKCGGNEEAGRIWFDQSEKMRKSLLRRLRKERRKLVVPGIVEHTGCGTCDLAYSAAL